MILKLIITFMLSFFVTNMPVSYQDDGIYQVNILEFSYTNGYGMNQDVHYLIDCENKCNIKIKEYEKDEDDVITIYLSDKDMDKIETMLNRYHILSWKGFSKSDKNVLDGDSFSFRLRYNDDEKLSASGYMMYPKYYREFKEAFEDYVSSLKEGKK